jgi:hypothetical protein
MLLLLVLLVLLLLVSHNCSLESPLHLLGHAQVCEAYTTQPNVDATT